VTNEVRVVDPVTGGEKGQKLGRFDLLPPEFELALAEHYGKNCKPIGKYDESNWLRGYDYSLSYAAMRRHINQYWSGEDIDEESGSHHLVAAAWHCVALYIFGERGLGTDNRPLNKEVI